ncbi:ExeA family protein [Acidovorax sp.]|uniref:ExeA family protein n=1 Tax=Acidovorax sp. TaxID=1872122 RepID=UPI002ACF0667|nr:AAA family ATPase [Acidovorax sp.]MDZ7862645.1 AAA family ATPase [Acidovorax sp.]
MLNLKKDLALLNLKQAAMARHVGISTASVCLACRYNKWPNGQEAALKDRIRKYLTANGATPEMVAATFDEAPAAPRDNAALQAMAKATNSGPQPGNDQPEDPFMLLRKYTINREARQHFRIPRDPFTDEMLCEGDVFLSDDIRYVRSAMRQTAKHGGMLAVVAESGGGKSTLRQDLAEWINSSGEPITVIEPFVIGMSKSEREGRPLKSADITGAVIRAVAPSATLKMRHEDRAVQMHSVLRASAQIGRKHVLIIEEAHDLAVPTLKHLKRFYELQDGFKKLLAIILIGQTELGGKLSEKNPEVREVVQRCEVVHLPALDNHVEAYLRHKLKRVDMDYDALFAPDVADEIRNRLRHSVLEVHRGERQQRTESLCHPLAINNLVSAALNSAVRIGAPKVTGALIAAAARSE